MKFNIFSRAAHRPHQWSEWYIAEESLIGLYGRTNGPINERKCTVCGIRQHDSLKSPSEVCKTAAETVG